jgi:CHAT domain-containing protein
LGILNPENITMNIYGDIYRSFQKVLINQKRFTTALEITEQNRIRTFQDSGVSINVHLQPLNYPQIKDLVKKVNTTLVYYSVLYDENQFYRFHRFHIVPKGENNLYFYPTEVLIWVIKPDGEMYCQEVDLQDFWQREMLSLGGLIRRINEGNKEDNFNKYQEDLSNLYKILIKPIADYLPNNPEETVTICPQDFLYFLPFSALIDENGKHLIEHHSLNTISSLSILEFVHNNQISHKKNCLDRSSLLIGNPSMPHIWAEKEKYPFVLPNLKEGKQEIKEISNLLKHNLIEGGHATKNQVIEAMKKVDFIHFTTYCLLDEMGGFPGAIALSPVLGDGGLLTPEEIAKLKLKGSLVTISHGYRKSSYIWGNSVEKISNAFILAGIENILLALWNHDHPATTLLLKEFYQHLQQNYHKSNALRQAMLITKNSYPHPYNWAYFSLLGIT